MGGIHSRSVSKSCIKLTKYLCFQIHVFPVNLEDCDNSQIVDNLRKILLSEDLDEEYVFSEGGGIERPYSPMVKNLSGCDDAYDELG